MSKESILEGRMPGIAGMEKRMLGIGARFHNGTSNTEYGPGEEVTKGSTTTRGPIGFLVDVPDGAKTIHVHRWHRFSVLYRDGVPVKIITDNSSSEQS